jgi:hypothetical protein
MSTGATSQAPQLFPDVVSKIAAGALIPSVATVIFNMLNFFFENFQKSPMPLPGCSVFDIGVGCAFSLVGICVATKEHSVSSALFILFVLLLFMLLGGDLVVVFLQWNRTYVIWITNFLSLFILSWAITGTKQQ